MMASEACEAVIVVRVSACTGLGFKRPLLLLSRLEHKPQNACADYK